MSHVAEVYAKDLGVKIGKPQLIEHFYPVLVDDYIVFNNQDNLQVNQYDYWGIVIDLIKPHLVKNNIDIITISDNDKISLNQKNHIIKKSLMYLGVLNHFTQVASAYDKPSVSLLSNVYAENRKPYGNAEVLTPDFSEIKPSFAVQEGKKRINEIKPEDIAKAILNKLNIKGEIKFKTIRPGNTFHKPSVEIVPNCFVQNKEFVNQVLNVRADLHFDLNNIINWCQLSNVNLTLKQTIPSEVLTALKNRIKQIIYVINEDKEDLTNFFKTIKRNKINLVIFTENKEILSSLRLKYFDFSVFCEHLDESVKDIVNENTKYHSSKKFISNNTVYPSHFSSEKLDIHSNFCLNSNSLKEIENFYLYE